MHEASGRPRTILLVEGERQILELVAAVLRETGYEVLGVHKPADAIVLCSDAAQVVDLVVSDFTMLGQDGTQLARDLRRIRPNLEFVFMSGSRVGFDALIAEGFVCLPKPVSFAEFLERIQERLDRARQSLADGPAVTEGG